MQELAPELEKLKQKFKDDKQGLVTAQAELYKQHGLNPASGCLPQVVQIVILIGLYNAFNSVLSYTGTDLVSHLNSFLYTFNQLPKDFVFSTKFFFLDLIKPDLIHIPGLPFALPGIFAILSSVSQFLSSKMMMPEVKKELKVAEKTPQSDDDMLMATQQQMLYIFPFMSLVLAYQFPSGLVIYWLIFSLASMVQQYLITGPGGLAPWLNRLSRAKIISQWTKPQK
jgi:YidC/Oxa1 family membrane protein insertase